MPPLGHVNAPLPPELSAALAFDAGHAPKRERTRRLLVQAALQVFGTRGLAAATIGEIAQAAGVAPATVYNHFASKEALVGAVALWVADTLCRCIADSCRDIPEGAERMAVGNRRYLWLAERSPGWALMLLDIGAQSPELMRATGAYVLADLRLGVRQKAFKVSTEAAALDLVGGTISQAMRVLAHGAAPRGHAAAVTTLVLAALGVPLDSARLIARRPLPPLRAPDAAPPASRPTARRRR